MIDSAREYKSVTSQYVTSYVMKPNTPAVVTAVVTTLVAVINNQQQRIVPAQTSTRITKIDVWSDNKKGVLEELLERARTRPKREILLTDRFAVATEEEEYDASDFDELLPPEWRGQVRGADVTPLFYFRLSKDGRIIASKKPIEGSVIRGYLIRANLSMCGVGPHNFRDVLTSLGVYSKYFRKGVEEKEDDEILNDIAGVPAFYYVDVNPALGKIALRRWEEFMYEVLFKGADDFMVKVYLPGVAPFNGFPIKVAPNIILGSPTGTGKTTLASAMGKVYERITEASLHGGKFGDTVGTGVVHGFDGLVQIETLERNALQNIVGGLLGLTARGEALIATYGSEVRTEFKGPIYITFNTQGGTQKVIAETLARVALAIEMNPEALAGRFILLASRYVLPLGENPLILNNVTKVVAEAIQAAKRLAQNKLATLLDPPTIIKYVKDVSTEIDEVPFVEFNSQNLQTYFQTLRDTVGKHVARMGLCAATARHLDDIYNGQITRDALLRKALEQALKYKEMVDRTIKEVGDLLDESLEEYLSTLPKNKEKKFIFALITALYNTAVSEGGLVKWGAVRKGEVLEIKVEKLFEEFKNTRIYANISLPKFKAKLESPMVSNDPALGLAGFNYIKEKGIVICDLSQLLYIAEVLHLKTRFLDTPVDPSKPPV